MVNKVCAQHQHEKYSAASARTTTPTMKRIRSYCDHWDFLLIHSHSGWNEPFIICSVSWYSFWICALCLSGWVDQLRSESFFFCLFGNSLRSIVLVFFHFILCFVVVFSVFFSLKTHWIVFVCWSYQESRQCSHLEHCSIAYSVPVFNTEIYVINHP